MRRKKKGNLLSKGLRSLSKLNKGGGGKRSQRMQKLFVVAPGTRSRKRRY